MTTPVDPGDTGALPPRDAKALVTYWTLDCMLDWVFMHPDGSWYAENHYDRLRDEMNADVVPPDCVVVRRDDLRHAVSAFDAIGTGPDDHDAYLRLRAAIGGEG